MKVARVRLIAAAVLFVGWLGYLAFLALGHSKPIVVSHSQLLVASYLVKADVAIDERGKPEPTVHLRESFGPNKVSGDTINIQNLSEARLPGGKRITAAGTYLLPLTSELPPPGQGAVFRVVAAPTGRTADGNPLWLVYPFNPDVERQLAELVPREK